MSHKVTPYFYRVQNFKACAYAVPESILKMLILPKTLRKNVGSLTEFLNKPKKLSGNQNRENPETSDENIF